MAEKKQKKKKKSTSFLPEDYVEKKTQRRTNVISLALFLVVMVSIIGAFLVTDRQGVERRRLQQQVNGEFEEAAKRLEQLEDLQQRKDQMLRKARVTAKLIERVPRSLLFAELINQMPATLSLLEFEINTKVQRSRPKTMTALDKAKQARNDNAAKEEDDVPPSVVSLRLVGVAPTDVQVAQFMTSLSRSTMFTDVNLAYSEEANLVDDHLMRRFSIDLKLNQQVNVQKLEPTMVQRQLKQNPMGNTIQIDASGQLVVPTEPAPNIMQAGDAYPPESTKD